MKIAFNPSTVAALIAPPNNKDITFDLRGHNIFARGVKFCGTDTNTWRDIKINNVSIDSNILDLRDGDNTTLTNINGVVTINSTWRPVVDNLTSDSTTSSLSANLGRVLKALIDGKSDSGHTHDDRYLRLTGGTMNGNARIGHGSGNLYIGNSGNDGWVAIQDICSQDSIGDGKWSIRVDGTASFQSIKFPSNRLIAQVSSGSNSPLKGIKLPYLQSNGIGIFSRVGNGADEGGIILSEDTCVIYNSFDAGWGLSVRNKDLNETDISSDDTVAFGIRENTYKLYSRGGFEKKDSSDDYVLLGGGGHKLESGLSVANANTMLIKSKTTENDCIPSVERVGCYYASLCTAHTGDAFILAFNTNNYIAQLAIDVDRTNKMAVRMITPSNTWTSWASIITSDNIDSQSVNYASNSDTLDGYHASSFLIDRGGDYSGLLYDLPCKSIFSGNNLSDAPVQGWVSGIVLGSNWNSSHYQHYLVEDGSRWYATRSASNGKMTDWNTFAYLTDNVASASKLQTPRTIWGNSFDGTRDVNGTIYINNSDSSNGAIRLNNNVNSNARISAIDSQVIFNTSNAIRFGENAWDFNQWAGLKYTHSNKTIYLGIADGSVFNSNSTLSGGTLNLRAGISNIDLNSGTSIRGLPTDGSPYSSSITLRDASIYLSSYGDISMSTGPGAIKLTLGYSGIKLSCLGNNASINPEGFKVEASRGAYLNSGNSGNVYLCLGGGNVGIGTTSPSYKLDVNGSAHIGGTLIINSILNFLEVGAIRVANKTIINIGSDGVDFLKGVSFNDTASFLKSINIRTGLTEYNAKEYSTSNHSVIIGECLNNTTFIFKPASDGLLLFMKLGKKYSNIKIQCTARDCIVVKADNFNILIGRNTTLNIYGDGVSRFFIYEAIPNRWIEFRCG